MCYQIGARRHVMITDKIWMKWVEWEVWIYINYLCIYKYILNMQILIQIKYFRHFSVALDLSPLAQVTFLVIMLICFISK